MLFSVSLFLVHLVCLAACISADLVAEHDDFIVSKNEDSFKSEYKSSNWINLDEYNGTASESLLAQEQLFRDSVVHSLGVTNLFEFASETNLDKDSFIPYEVSQRKSLTKHQLKYILKSRALIRFKDINTLLIPDKEFMNMSPKKLAKRITQGGAFKFHEVRYHTRTEPMIDRSFKIPASPCLSLIGGEGQGGSVSIIFEVDMNFQAGASSSASVSIGGLPTYLSLSFGGGLSTSLSRSTSISLSYGCQSKSDKPFRLFYYPSVVLLKDSEREIRFDMDTGSIKELPWEEHGVTKLFTQNPPSLFCGYSEDIDIQCEVSMDDIIGDGDTVEVIQSAFSVTSDRLFNIL